MSVKFSGPNPDFIGMKKDGGDVKVGSGKDVKLESVNHDDFSGRQRIADKNPGAGENSRKVHGKEPFTEGALTGFEQPKMGLEDGKIAGGEKLNEIPRGFKFNREGHKVDNGPISENAAK